MRKLYEKINNLLNKVDFEAIWPEFHKYPFALYNKEQVYFENSVIPYDERFRGNTSIEYENRYIAIWNVDYIDDDVEELASNMVHEMFHAFQCERGEKRFPKDLVTLSYPTDIKNYEMKHLENVKLAETYEKEEIDDKLSLLSEFASIRKKREAIIGEFIQCEYETETVEGIAEYCGTRALKQLNINKYNKRIENYIKILKKCDSVFFDPRRISYYVGALLMVMLNDVGISLYHNIGTAEKTVFEMVSQKMKLIDEFELDSARNIRDEVDKYIIGKKTKFQEFFTLNPTRNEVDCEICGYDPMNMIKVGNQILCSHFIALKDLKTHESRIIYGPVVIELKDKSLDEVKAYYKI